MFEIPKPKSVKEQSALIIDQQALVRDSIKNALFRVGVEYIRGADRAQQAISEFRSRNFEIVVISFDLNADKDGFHLLEELKFKGFIKKSTCVIFISADTDNSLVHSVVEMQPDDFWTKPLDHKKIEKRLLKVLDSRRKLFNPFYCADIGEYARAIYYAERYLKENRFPGYKAKLQRLVGDSLCNLGEFKDAEVFYRNLLKSVNHGWVNLGLTYSLLKQDKLDEAMEIVEKLKKRPDTRCSVYDLLANYYVDQDDYEQAYEEIKHAATLSPRNIERNRRAWDLARLNHDRQGQYQATLHMAKNAKKSIHDSPELTLNVIRSGIDLASASGEEVSQQIYRKVEKQVGDMSNQYVPSEVTCMLGVIDARLKAAQGDKAGAEKKLETLDMKEITETFEGGLDTAKLLHELGHREKAIALLKQVSERVSGDTFSSHIIQKYLEQELQERQTIHFSPKELAAQASTYYKQERLDPAYSALKKALKLSPKNTQIALSMLKVLAKMAESQTINDEQKDDMNTANNVLDGATLSEGQQEKLTLYRSMLEMSESQDQPQSAS